MVLAITAGASWWVRDGLWAYTDWWRTVAVVGLAVSLGLMVLFFHPWFLPIQGVNVSPALQ
jgi:hypothetical protein